MTENELRLDPTTCRDSAVREAENSTPLMQRVVKQAQLHTDDEDSDYESAF